MMLTPEQAKLSGHAQDAFHYALLASGDNSLSSFVGDRGTRNDARDEGYADSDKGLALYALARALSYAAKAGIDLKVCGWKVGPRSRRTLAEIRNVAGVIVDEIRRVSQAAGWNAYNDAPLADYPTGPGAEGMIGTTTKLLTHFGVDSIERLSRLVYKSTACGGGVTWLAGAHEGVRLHTIVEGSDAEFHEDLAFPFTIKEWDAAWARIEALADEAWKEEN